MTYPKLLIHLPCQEVDEDVQRMAEKMASSDVFRRIRLMPDCHVGSNCCVGMTDVLYDKMIPQIVGGDIIQSVNDDSECFGSHRFRIQGEGLP